MAAAAEGGGELSGSADPARRLPAYGFPRQRSGRMNTLREGWLLFVAALLLALIVVVTVAM